MVLIQKDWALSLDRAICDVIEVWRIAERTERMNIEKIDLPCWHCPIIDCMVVQRQNLGQDTLCVRYHPGDHPPKWA